MFSFLNLHAQVLNKIGRNDLHSAFFVVAEHKL